MSNPQTMRSAAFWASAVLIFVAPIELSAQQLSGVDGRKDWYEVMNDPDLAHYQQATALLVRKGEDISEETFNGFHRLYTHDWVAQPDFGCPTLCPDMPYYGQQVAGRTTAILVAPDRMLVGIHSDPGSGFCNNFWYVFDYLQRAPDDPPVLPDDTYPGYVEVPEDNVVKCESIVDMNVQGEWLVVELEEAVAGRIPLVMNRKYVPDVGTPLQNLAHAFHLPLKFEEAFVTAVIPRSTIQEFRLTTIPVHIGPGSTGSPVVNRLTGFLEGRIIGGVPGWIVYGDDMCCTHCESSCFIKGTAKLAVAAAEAIDPIGFDVDNPNVVGVEDPRIPVNHRGPIGGPMTNPTTTYRLTSNEPVGKNGRVLPYEVEVGMSTGPQPVVLLNGGVTNLSGKLKPGESVDVVVTVNPAAIGDAQVADSTVMFRDLTYRTTEFRPHHLAVNYEAIVATPVDDLDGDGPGAQPGDRMTWVVENIYDVPVTVRASSIAVDSVVGPTPPAPYLVAGSQVYTIPCGGRVFITAAYASSFPPELPPGIYSDGGILFSLVDCCDVISFGGRLDYGRIFQSPDIALPVPIPEGQTVSVPFRVSDNFVVSDVDFQLELTVAETSRFTMELESPQGTVVRFSDFMTVEDSDYHVVFDNDTPDDGETESPLQSLEAFAGRPAKGTWIFRLFVAAGGDPSDQIDNAVLRLLPSSSNDY
ncbi:MAG: hypothetical protein MI923_27625 [Phycisphaerales bacterium]|nr:hypothetical protein [Phycisphaerales bacterium]